MTFEVKDLAGFSEPMKKLIEVVSSGLGTVFRPRTRKADADATAYEIKAIAKAKAEAGQIALEAALKNVETIRDAAPELVERARQRLLSREIEGQLNIEAIAEIASQQLPNSVTSDPVSTSWRRKFFMEAENVCEADMQLLWGKVLAGEISKPGTFNVRTLETLKQLTREEAELFRKACRLSMDTGGWIAVPGHDLNVALKPYGIGYGEILQLRDAGLAMSGDNLHRTIFDQVKAPESTVQVFANNGVLIQVIRQVPMTLNVMVVQFTQAGEELRRLIEFDPNEDYFKALGEYWRSKNVVVKRGVSMPEKDGVSVITFEQDL